ncbi:MAG: hypothetical protein M3Q55_00150 [Acidobacteriota bacterium]|nr:hypothetical protein [Acidobacteriota bacterium]
MKARDAAQDNRLREALVRLEASGLSLPGIEDDAARDVLIRQLLESVHRVNYVGAIVNREISPRRADPNDPIFDPIRAAILHARQSNIDEAFWLVFLFVHFGKNLRGGWRYLLEVYGRLGEEPSWSWAQVTGDPDGFRAWLADKKSHIGRNTVPGGFGNHRKYESLDALGPSGTGASIAGYVRWVAEGGGHAALFRAAVDDASGDARMAFNSLFRTMKVVRFGRTAKFDYLAMVGKIGLAVIEPDAAYFENRSGPTLGARLLFAGSKNAPVSIRELESLAKRLDSGIQVGMQAIEDALCNWQKTPNRFKAFRG